MLYINKVINFIENQSLTFGGWVISFFTLLGLNLFFQFITYGFKKVSFEYFIGEVIQPYYFILYLAIVIFLYLIVNKKLKVECRKSNVECRNLNVESLKVVECVEYINSKNTKYQQNKNVKMLNVLKFVLWGFWSIIFWPIIDKIILKDNFYLSFYLYDSVEGVLNNLVTFFGPIVPVGILYGTRIETVFIILIIGFYIYHKTESFLRVFFGAVGVYVIFYISVALPSILVFVVAILSGESVLEITKVDVVKVFNTPLQYFGSDMRSFEVTFFYKISLFYNLIFIGLLVYLQWLWNKNILKNLMKNIRFPQMIFNWGLLSIGVLVGLFYVPENLTKDIFSGIIVVNLFLSVLFAWLFSVVVNDIEDYEIDKISNKNRPLVVKNISKRMYLNYGWVFLFLSLLLSLSVDNKTFLIIGLYNLLTIVYSRQPFKLKRIPWIAGTLSSLASLLIFLIGYLLITGSQSAVNFPWKAVLFLGISYALVLPIKDLKDIKSDKQNNVLTVANLLGEKVARIYFGVAVFLIYICSFAIFNLNRLFLPGVIFGGISYWIINNQKNSRDKLLYKLLLIVIFWLGIILFI
jgi:4-hydroxybenzoate polyprenyltransferase